MSDGSGYHDDFGNNQPRCCGREPMLRVEERYHHNDFASSVRFVCRICANAGQAIPATGYPNIDHDRAAQYWRLSDHELSATQQERNAR